MLVALCASVLHVQAQPQPVARVVLAVGTAQMVNASGGTQPVALGSQLFERDRIITGKDAMVLLVFADQGRVALRADTELVIRRYHVDGADSQLQLDLVRGSARQISGSAARSQPERYRLNTPIAAIGVRGTDFLVKVSAQSMEAYVHEGTIVVLPSADKSVAGIEHVPLASVSSGDVGRYLEVRPEGRIERRTISADDIEQIFGIRISANRPVLATPASEAVADAKMNTGVSLSVGGGAGGAAASVATGQRGNLASSQEPVIQPPITPSTPTYTTPPVAPSPPVAVVPQLPLSLVWGRFSDPQALPWQLPASYQEASAGRHPTVGELGQFALWRANPRGSLDTSLRGQVDFAFAAGEALFLQGPTATPIQIQQPRLAADFDTLRFNTQLQLTGANVAAQNLNVAGRINDEGIFVGSAGAQRVAGALSLNGREAGYTFQIPVSAGTYQGITLWKAK